MADTERSISALQTLLADNSTGAISAQDIRDMLVSLLAPRGSYYIADGNTAETSISAVDTWTKLAGTTTAGPNETIRDFEHVASNRLKYTGAPERDVLVLVSITAQSAANNKDFEFSIAKNGSQLDPTEQVQRFGNANESKSVSISSIVNMSTNDYIEAYVQNQTDGTNITATKLQVVAVGFLD